MNKVAKIIFECTVLFVIGGSIYYGLEMLWRGYSHFSMFITAGISFLIIGCLNEVYTWEMSFLKQCIIGSIVITTLEFICGCIVNLWLGWNVWDYSQMPFNILGQICLPFSLIWIVLSGVAIVVDDWIRYLIFNEDKPHYYWFKNKSE